MYGRVLNTRNNSSTALAQQLPEAVVTNAKFQLRSNMKTRKVETALDLDAEMLRNRVSKLRMIESKMLRKIDKTRQEADRVRRIKD